MSLISRSLRTDKKRRHLRINIIRIQRLRSYLNKTIYVRQISNFKNYCQITGASHSYDSFFGLSRHSLRKFANFGNIPGVQKSSW
jgi:ribosomal protein S14